MYSLHHLLTKHWLVPNSRDREATSTRQEDSYLKILCRIEKSIYKTMIHFSLFLANTFSMRIKKCTGNGLVQNCTLTLKDTSFIKYMIDLDSYVALTLPRQCMATGAWRHNNFPRVYTTDLAFRSISRSVLIMFRKCITVTSSKTGETYQLMHSIK